MFRFALLATTVLICIASLSCQNYSTGLQQSVTRLDETVATGTLRTIASAQQAYAVSNGGNFGTFQQLTDGDYLDERFKSDTPAAQTRRIKDYVLTMAVGSDSGGPYFRCNADPVGPKEGRHFYIDSSANALRSNPTQPASASDPIQP
ncbi:MAG: hypothetical protein ACREA9_03055 [Pyrinomonadaceae bacterium]